MELFWNGRVCCKGEETVCNCLKEMHIPSYESELRGRKKAMGNYGLGSVRTKRSMLSIHSHRPRVLDETRCFLLIIIYN